MSSWLMKSEPTEYSIDHLQRDGSSSWYGVRNYQARNYMRDYMQLGDQVFFYHSSCQTPGIVGFAEVVSLPHPDETQFIIGDKHYDPKASRDKPRWICVDVGFVSKFDAILSITEIRSIPELATMKLLQKGSRLSITPVADYESEVIMGIIESRISP
ncbi:EVE domain-containing protein [Candidatus Gracilibacteria bacterium]|nr:EVE domain-containing protein [Candidatus Gracilibacteria bacterium]